MSNGIEHITTERLVIKLGNILKLHVRDIKVWYDTNPGFRETQPRNLEVVLDQPSQCEAYPDNYQVDY